MCCLLCFAKLGCGSEMKMKVFWTFILHFTHLALTLLRQVRLRFGNENESLWTFILHFTHLALTLHLKTHDECFRYYK